MFCGAQLITILQEVFLNIIRGMCSVNTTSPTDQWAKTLQTWMHPLYLEINANSQPVFTTFISTISTNRVIMIPAVQKISYMTMIEMFITVPADAHQLAQCGSPLIPAWITYHTLSKVRDEINYPTPNCSGWTVEDCACTINSTPHFVIDVITYTWCTLS